MSLQALKKARNVTRKFSSAVRMVRQQKNADVTQQIIKKLEEDSEQYTDRFNTMDNEVQWDRQLLRQSSNRHTVCAALSIAISTFILCYCNTLYQQQNNYVHAI